ncbi:MAG TPA: CBO0543 family protein [Ureibacillus sp.]|uniref:CBO0543 family protein n=1 Tax=Peribacillus asahii TaxID=228899 RepID=UPI00207AD88C|nr:CBO0543 family protein [Peribacillus asahii]USK61642.1 hypothetical protein LIT37_10150 [Peribacillus asahii]HWL22673.1 CBO0543 family protein [Ureibacillus sp.]
MKKHNQINLLRALSVIGLLIFLPLIRKKPSKHMNEWIIVFFMKSYISSFVDTIVNKKGYVKYPINLFKIFDISVLFNYLIFPLTCVYFNQLTRKSSLLGIISKTLLFSIPMSLAEDWLQKNTKLISYKKGWNSFISFTSISITFLLVRGIMAIIRLANTRT